LPKRSSSLAARGLSNRQIAKELRISEATIKRHLANVYEKIGVHSRNEAVRKALEEQWIGIHEITSASANGNGSAGGPYSLDGSRLRTRRAPSGFRPIHRTS
jgi:hypothetical protein